jgi:hypothetical protein
VEEQVTHLLTIPISQTLRSLKLYKSKVATAATRMKAKLIISQTTKIRRVKYISLFYFKFIVERKWLWAFP